MRLAAIAWTAALAMLAAPAHADSRSILACAGPADPAPCLIEGGEPDRAHLPITGPAARVSGNRLVISWVGEADEVRVAGNLQLLRPALPEANCKDRRH